MMQSYQGASKVLYVGNLDKRCTEEFLKQVFGKIAPVERCKMIADHTGSDPYCFVEFQDHESAKNALDTMNGRRVFDQDIKVNWATSNTGMRKDTSSHFHIFVGDLPDAMTTELLKSSFDKFGVISRMLKEGKNVQLPSSQFNQTLAATDARVVCDPATGNSKGYGFVSFVNKISAENAIKDMNGKTLDGKQIRTNWASKKPQPPQGRVKKLDYNEVSLRSSNTNTTVYVGNLPEYIVDKQLTDAFSEFGTITNIRVLADKRYAFISFVDHNQATNAICGMHGETLQDSVLKCSWGKEQPPQGQAQYYGHQQAVMYGAHMGPGAYFGAPQSQQQQQQQQHYQQQQQQWATQYMQMNPYYYHGYATGQMQQQYPNYAGAGGQHMSGGGQQGPNGVPNSVPQGGAAGYSMQ